VAQAFCPNPVVLIDDAGPPLFGYGLDNCVKPRPDAADTDHR
jgi:hypothetical protein